MSKRLKFGVFRCVWLSPFLVLFLQQHATSQDKSPAVRSYDADGVVAPRGYAVETFAAKLDFPVDIAFGDSGEVYVAEAGGHTYGTTPDKAPPAQIVQLLPTGEKRVIYDHMVPMNVIKQHDSSADMPEGLIPPVTGLTWHQGKLYVSHRSRYSVLDPQTGDFRTIVDGLPCWGEFLNAKPIFDRDGKMVFFISTQGNSGVIERHWMKVINVFNKKKAHEIPGEDVQLTGKNFPVPVEDPKTPGVDDKKMTGAYVPLGVKTDPGYTVKGQTICNGAFFRCNPDGTGIERIAWGFRSSLGYRFSPDGRLICTQNSANPMPPRGLWYDWESIYEVVPGEWYGWPDYYSGVPITNERFAVHKGKGEFVLTDDTHRRLLRGRDRPIQPLLRLPPHAAAQGMVFARADFGLNPDNILIAEMGTIVPQFKGKQLYPPGKQAGGEPMEEDQPSPGNPPSDIDFNWPGFKVQLIDLESGQAQDFLKNRHAGPATAGTGSGLERPLQLEWGPDGALYVVDFGIISLTPMGMKAHPHTGVIWRVSRREPRVGASSIRQ
jgi:glucose/arabinose dehydrogenase